MKKNIFSKKIISLFLISLIIFSGICFIIKDKTAQAKTTTPVSNQTHFRWRNDNGDETGATWKELEDTNTSKPKNQNIRLRVAWNESAGANPNLSVDPLRSWPGDLFPLLKHS